MQQDSIQTIMQKDYTRVQLQKSAARTHARTRTHTRTLSVAGDGLPNRPPTPVGDLRCCCVGLGSSEAAELHKALANENELCRNIGAQQKN